MKFQLNVEYNFYIIISAIDGIILNDFKFGNSVKCRPNIPYQINAYDTIEFHNLKVVIISDKSRDILRDKLIALYSQYQPDKLPVVDTVIDQWEMSKLSGDNLLEILNQRYCGVRSENEKSLMNENEEDNNTNNKNEDESITLDTISLSPIKLAVDIPNKEENESQQTDRQVQSLQQQSQSQSQEISIITPLVIGNNNNTIPSTNTKLRKRLDENMRAIDTPVVEKKTLIGDNNDNDNSKSSDETNRSEVEKMKDVNEKMDENSCAQSSIEDISDIVTFVNIKNNNNSNGNNNGNDNEESHLSSQLNSTNNQVVNLSTPSSINVTNTTSDNDSNISTPIIILNKQNINDNNNDNNCNSTLNESFSSLTTPSPVKTNISLIKSFESSTTATPSQAITPLQLKEFNDSYNNSDDKKKDQRINEEDLKETETEIIKREPIDKMLEMGNEVDEEEDKNQSNQMAKENQILEDKSYSKSEIVVNFEEKEGKGKNEEEDVNGKMKLDEEKIDIENNSDIKEESENKNEANENKKDEGEKEEKEEKDKGRKVEEDVKEEYEITVRKTRSMIKREEEEEEEKKRKEEKEEKINSKNVNYKRKTVLTRRNTRSRKVKEEDEDENENEKENNENDDEENEIDKTKNNSDDGDKYESESKSIEETNNETQHNIEKEEKRKSPKKEVTRIEVNKEIVKLEKEINEEILTSQVYGKSIDSEEELKAENNENVKENKRKRRISGEDNNEEELSPTKKPKQSSNANTRTKRKRSSESPSNKNTNTDLKKRKFSVSSDYHIAITGLEKSECEPIVKALGGIFETDITKATHLLVKNLKRTIKLMYAMCSDIHILSSKWLFDSKKKGYFINEKTYIPSDPKTEKEYHYHFINSYVTRNTRQKPLFEGYNFYLTPNVIPPVNDLSDLIRKGGGNVISNMRDINRYEGTTLIVANETDIDTIPKKYRDKVYSTQLIICSIMEQKIVMDSHLIIDSK